MFQDLGSSEGAMEAEPQEELGVQRRKELNRIKKKYGLRVCKLKFFFLVCNFLLQ